MSTVHFHPVHFWGIPVQYVARHSLLTLRHPAWRLRLLTFATCALIFVYPADVSAQRRANRSSRENTRDSNSSHRRLGDAVPMNELQSRLELLQKLQQTNGMQAEQMADFWKNLDPDTRKSIEEAVRKSFGMPDRPPQGTPPNPNNSEQRGNPFGKGNGQKEDGESTARSEPLPKPANLPDLLQKLSKETGLPLDKLARPADERDQQNSNSNNGKNNGRPKSNSSNSPRDKNSRNPDEMRNNRQGNNRLSQNRNGTGRSNEEMTRRDKDQEISRQIGDMFGPKKSGNQGRGSAAGNNRANSGRSNGAANDPWNSIRDQNPGGNNGNRNDGNRNTGASRADSIGQNARQRNEDLNGKFNMKDAMDAFKEIQKSVKEKQKRGRNTINGQVVGRDSANGAAGSSRKTNPQRSQNSGSKTAAQDKTGLGGIDWSGSFSRALETAVQNVVKETKPTPRPRRGRGSSRNSSNSALANRDGGKPGFQPSPNDWSPPKEPAKSGESFLTKVQKGTKAAGEFFEETKKWIPKSSPNESSPTFAADSPEATAFGGEGFAANTPRSLILLIVVGVVGVAAYWFLSNSLKSQADAEADSLELSRLNLKDRQDLLRAFHTLALRSHGVAGDWWTHRQAEPQMAKQFGQSMNVLADLYEHVRYAPNPELPADKLAQARDIIRQADRQ